MKNSFWQRFRVINPAVSRKALAALVTLIVAVGGKLGFDLPPDAVTAVVAIGVALILGVAVEDAGAKSRGRFVVINDAPSQVIVPPPSEEPPPSVPASGPSPENLAGEEFANGNGQAK
ncbi:MAG TPA: hypothetical protein ENI79_04730 [Rhodospirillales bacterium]|nr:hypothetical protein [Rhodospirillales bacterium]